MADPRPKVPTGIRKGPDPALYKGGHKLTWRTRKDGTGKQANCECGWVSPVRNDDTSAVMCPHDPKFITESLEEETPT